MNLEELEREQKLEIPKVGSLYQVTWCFYKHSFGLPQLGDNVFIYDRSLKEYPTNRRTTVMLHCVWGERLVGINYAVWDAIDHTLTTFYRLGEPSDTSE
jgi:hypothetical protein